MSEALIVNGAEIVYDKGLPPAQFFALKYNFQCR